MKIPLSRPDIKEDDIKAVLSVLKTPNLSLGPKIEEFEEKVAGYTGARYAIAVNSGTSGLHLSVIAAGIKSGDEVITTPFSFIASANCILYAGARPVFVDIDPVTLNMDTYKIEEKITERTRAILPVHVFGVPCEMDHIIDIAKRHRLTVIEDACEAIGAEYKGKKVGLSGLTGVFAFYPNKQMTTGEGGVIVTNKKGIAEMLKSLRNQGRAKNGRWLSHKRLGYNYRLSDIHAALGISQLERLDEILKKREEVALYYMECLKDIDKIELPSVPEHTKVSWFVFVIRLKKGFTKKHRDRLMEMLMEKGIECGNYFPPIHLQPFYRKFFGYKRGDFPVCESLSERTIALPFFNNLKKGQIEYIADNITSCLKTL
ncbi:MAG TPA: DegT/DnrJ/EryC1/StrS family aminotransferase [Syntrophorhabdaceae bacterium]|nr:DegT/DnrJ/EryC1/StrS family aminotransferase [Syntrophorhabdaceae bacterium]